MLQYMACPINPDDPLAVVRGDAGQVVTLRSKNSSYPVVDNVPCMIPDLQTRPGRDRTLWQGLQDKTWQNYQDGSRNVFSEDDKVSHYLGEIIAQRSAGLFLDVGCGVLPSPDYMAAAGSQIRWIGVDPLFGNVARHFPFAQAIGEYLPFRPHTFDGVLYASTIYYQVDPRQSLERARRVVKPLGKLYLWYEPEHIDVRYVGWRIRRMLGWPSHYSNSLRWAFTKNSLRSLLTRAGFSIEEQVLLCVECPEYATCRDPSAFLVIAR